MTTREEWEDRCVGSLLGTFCGDVLGAAVEGMSRRTIQRRFGEVRELLPTAQGSGRYTDDTQMTLALARSLVRCEGRVEGEDCARSYVEHFASQRGYGRSAARILEALAKEKADWRQTGTRFFPQGSFGNGAAMRIAPVGLLFGAAGPEELRRRVFAAVRCTHVHPEAVDGAVVQARLVGRMARTPRGRIPEAVQVLSQLGSECHSGIMQERLSRVGRLLQENAGADEAVESLGVGVRTAESVPAAVWVALRFGEEPEEALVQAVGLGGDTDTIAAMVGAQVGALHGRGWVPERWFRTLENGPQGRDEIMATAKELARIAVRA